MDLSDQWNFNDIKYQGSVIQTTEIQTGFNNKYGSLPVIEIISFGDESIQVRIKGMSTFPLLIYDQSCLNITSLNLLTPENEHTVHIFHSVPLQHRPIQIRTGRNESARIERLFSGQYSMEISHHLHSQFPPSPSPFLPIHLCLRLLFTTFDAAHCPSLHIF